jgi:hypothetical protein
VHRVVPNFFPIKERMGDDGVVGLPAIARLLAAVNGVPSRCGQEKWRERIGDGKRGRSRPALEVVVSCDRV